ncbi:DSD1 family PLP-dependent enzyme [Parvibaculum sp.]|uniref:DSD1 family PLP-dependent enzyme n=1 Tax=Parvibaculum sp. TaxID=2024848 RepID=UPI001B162C8D|nr:DSD1 family PLP-dependent enzyme [Parvibaculum sp.]MBO6633301.1 DSD1 family PLP-dependent enzyme [Parvibaculum sp.]MBO6678338.1 DSD1 family PLP-dependent enzyme [Parvibaculum sp.]MBO6685294.1 DSD1 family PLP-dependent enzyme [Parvibaculum sp.]MBO6904651.1 DSD1 family PLP-dependent enzyme [Parvibaculum sp.]
MTSDALIAAKALIGQPGSRAMIPTPALVLDLEAFERNVARMAEHCKVNGLAVRPHSKTHKSVTIAKAQVAAGALGVCCAKLGEAEAMAAGGIESILITSPVVTAQGIERLVALNAKLPDLMVVVDNPENARALAAAAAEEKRTLKVLVDLDVGLHRTGIRPGADATDLAELLDAAEFLELRGLQAYAGHLMHVHDFAERREKSLGAMKMLGEQRDALNAKGLCCDIVSGGGTGSYNIDPEAKVLTELQGGSYIFMDKQYNDVALGNGASFPFETALFVQMSVVSNNTKNLATTDAGFKSFSTDAEPPVLFSGAPEGAGYFFFGDEQGGILLPDGAQLPLGSVLTAMTPHCDPTVNLYDAYHVVKGDTLVDIWPIEARGRSA